MLTRTPSAHVERHRPVPGRSPGVLVRLGREAQLLGRGGERVGERVLGREPLHRHRPVGAVHRAVAEVAVGLQPAEGRQDGVVGPQVVAGGGPAVEVRRGAAEERAARSARWSRRPPGRAAPGRSARRSVRPRGPSRPGARGRRRAMRAGRAAPAGSPRAARGRPPPRAAAPGGRRRRAGRPARSRRCRRPRRRRPTPAQRTGRGPSTSGQVQPAHLARRGAGQVVEPVQALGPLGRRRAAPAPRRRARPGRPAPT